MNASLATDENKLSRKTETKNGQKKNLPNGLNMVFTDVNMLLIIYIFWNSLNT